MKLSTNCARVVIKIVKLETATAYFVCKWKNAMANGVDTPPPPTPAMLLNVLKMAKQIHPPTSSPVGGKTFL